MQKPLAQSESSEHDAHAPRLPVVPPVVVLDVTLIGVCVPGLSKNDDVRAPPVAGLRAMVQPEAAAEKHMVAAEAAGMVVFTTNVPKATVGL